jgi:hypothetical protein
MKPSLHYQPDLARFECEHGLITFPARPGDDRAALEVKAMALAAWGGGCSCWEQAAPAVLRESVRDAIGQLERQNPR